MENIVWDSERRIIDKNFNYMIDNYYGKFEFKYNWNKNILISDYLKRLFIDSFIEDKKIRYDLQILIHDYETFLTTAINNKIFNNDNILYIYRLLKNSIRTIKYEDMTDLSKYSKDSIILNSDIKNYLKSSKESILSPQELRRLYLYKEISNKIINSENDNFVDKYVDSLNNILRDRGVTDMYLNESLIADGIDMMYKTLAQNFAEHILYKSLKKDRPKYKITIFEGFPIVSNFEENGIYQKPVIDIGKTLAGVSRTSDSETMLNMARVSFETSLTELIASEYNMGTKEKYYDLGKVYAGFGTLLRANTKKSNTVFKLDIKKVFNLIDTITKRNLSTSQILIEDIRPINIDEYLNA
jgi:hypothetical protein